MKALRLYLEEIFTTPLTTTGMGNPSAPTDDCAGSGDVLIFKPKKIKKIKKIKKEN